MTRVGVDALGLGREAHHQAMLQRRAHDAIDVVDRDVRAAVEQRLHLGAEQQRLAAARARAVGDAAAHLGIGAGAPAA